MLKVERVIGLAFIESMVLLIIQSLLHSSRIGEADIISVQNSISFQKLLYNYLQAQSNMSTKTYSFDI